MRLNEGHKTRPKTGSRTRKKTKQRKGHKMRNGLAALGIIIAVLIGLDNPSAASLFREILQTAIDEAGYGAGYEGDYGTEPSLGENGQTSPETGEIEPLTVTFIDVGQGDSILLQCGEHNMMIDAGKNDQGTKLQAYLESKGIEDFDYLVGTHPDEDHIGGLDVIITKFQAEHVLMPDEEADTKTYDDVIQALKYRSIPLEHPSPGDRFYLGDAFVTVLGPPQKEYKDRNNCSIVLMVTHGNNRFLFMGDAEEEEEKDILESGADVKADVLKVGHHGSSTSSSQEFLDAVSPSAAVISCGEGNSYGHPHAETTNKLRAMGISTYRTDKEGAIVVESDGEELIFNVPPSQW